MSCYFIGGMAYQDIRLKWIAEYSGCLTFSVSNTSTFTRRQLLQGTKRQLQENIPLEERKQLYSTYITCRISWLTHFQWKYLQQEDRNTTTRNEQFHWESPTQHSSKGSPMSFHWKTHTMENSTCITCRILLVCHFQWNIYNMISNQTNLIEFQWILFDFNS